MPSCFIGLGEDSREDSQRNHFEFIKGPVTSRGVNGISDASEKVIEGAHSQTPTHPIKKIIKYD